MRESAQSATFTSLGLRSPSPRTLSPPLRVQSPEPPPQPPRVLETALKAGPCARSLLTYSPLTSPLPSRLSLLTCFLSLLTFSPLSSHLALLSSHLNIGIDKVLDCASVNDFRGLERTRITTV